MRFEKVSIDDEIIISHFRVNLEELLAKMYAMLFVIVFSLKIIYFSFSLIAS